MEKVGSVAALAGASVVVASAAVAQETPPASTVNLDSLVSAVDFSSVPTAIMSVAGSVIAVLVVLRAVRWVYAVVR